jgi:hypothetical protein
MPNPRCLDIGCSHKMGTPDFILASLGRSLNELRQLFGHLHSLFLAFEVACSLFKMIEIDAEHNQGGEFKW